jgi:hypothetical protein
MQVQTTGSAGNRFSCRSARDSILDPLLMKWIEQMTGLGTSDSLWGAEASPDIVGKKRIKVIEGRIILTPAEGGLDSEQLPKP